MASASYQRKQKKQRAATGRANILKRVYTPRTQKPDVSVDDGNAHKNDETIVQGDEPVFSWENEGGSVLNVANGAAEIGAPTPQILAAGSSPRGCSQEITKISAETPQLSAAALLSTPVGFAEGLLKVSLYPWQQEVLNWTLDMQASRNKIALLAANGSGKSERVIACAALRWVSVAPQGRVIITSKDSRQLDLQIFPALQQHRGRFKDFEWLFREIRTPRGGSINGFVTDESGRAEGHHAKLPDSPLLFIVDEAKSVSDDIFQAIDRCTYNCLLLVSSTGLKKGRLYEAFNSLAGWKTRKVTADECPHISEEDKQDVINTYGLNHPFTRSRLFSEFMDEDGDFQVFCTIGDIEKCMQSPPTKQGGDVVAFCDFAGGGDENVLSVRRGNAVQIVRAWREANEMAAVGEFIRLFRQEKLQAQQIWADAGGAGKPMISRLNEVGWQINAFNGGSPAYKSDDYFNRVTEVWAEATKQIKDGKVILPDDKVLHSQICNRRMLVRSDGRVWAEPKQGAQSLQSRGVKSPDRADAVLGAIAVVKQTLQETWVNMFPGHQEEDFEDLFGNVSKLAGVAGG